MNVSPTSYKAPMRFGRWTVMYRVGRQAACRCDCGTHRLVYWCHLKSGKSLSCGCVRSALLAVIKSTHGLMRPGRHHPLASVWSNMIQRCTNPRRPDFKNYGGRGIAVCERWRSLESFVADMPKRPRGATLDRINNDGNYEPGNVRWATRSVQARNRRPR